MTDRTAFMRAICERPEDDVCRLVLADHYEENGEPERAEFVRVQIELASDHSDCGAKGYLYCGDACERLRSRELKLFAGSGPLWWSNLPGQWRATVGADSIETADGWKFFIRRGFVSAVRTTLAHWVGVVCQRCGGDGRAHGADRPFEWSPEVNYGKCVVCMGERRTPAHGPRIVAEQPVETVQLSDRRPFSNLKVDGGMEYGFEQHDEGGAPGTGMLPTDIFDLLEGHYRQPNKFRKWWPTEAAANAALSLALVQWARREAGLPPLPHTR